MDQVKIGGLIRLLRKEKNMTQLELASKIGVSDKAVSKWERGRGAPDLSLLPSLAEALSIDTKSLLLGELDKNNQNSGNMKKTMFFVCPNCGNLLLSSDAAGVVCCGRILVPSKIQIPDDKHRLDISISDGEWYITSSHEMSREHYLSFVALITDDTLILKRLYPQWDAAVRLPLIRSGKLLWYCTSDGLFAQDIEYQQNKTPRL